MGCLLSPVGQNALRMPPIDTAVIQNPTLEDVASLLRAAKGGALRAAKDYKTGDIYIWDAEDALHRPMIEHLGLIMGDSLGIIWSVEQAKDLFKG